MFPGETKLNLILKYFIDQYYSIELYLRNRILQTPMKVFRQAFGLIYSDTPAGQ